MNDRVDRVLKYFKPFMDDEYYDEADFLSRAKDFAAMMPKVLVVRAEAVTRSGIADLLLCCDGKFIACELKSAKGTPSPQQLIFIDKVHKAGGLADVCYTLTDVWNIISPTVTRS